MSHRRAKKIRQRLLPHARAETGASRGQVIRALTKYEIVAGRFLVLNNNCPRAVLQRAKKHA